MSHKATTWAIQQRGISPAAKLVLWHLCDRYHPDHGCFPSQETLADDCEMSRASLNNQLATLEQAKLIRRERRHDEATNRRQSTLYRLAFEDGFKPVDEAEPCPNIGHGAMSKPLDMEPCPKNEPFHVQIVGHAIEPVIEPVRSERERAREDEEQFSSAFRSWPTSVSDSRDEARKAWQALSAAERAEASSEIKRYLETVKAVGRKHVCSFGRYLAERRWEGLPPRRQEAATAATAAEAAPAPTARPTAFMLSHPHLYRDRWQEFPELVEKAKAMGVEA